MPKSKYGFTITMYGEQEIKYEDTDRERTIEKFKDTVIDFVDTKARGIKDIQNINFQLFTIQ